MCDKLLKWVCREFGSSFASSLEDLADRQNVDFSVGVTLKDVHQNWLNLVHFMFHNNYSKLLYGFSVTISRCYKYFYVSRFFLRMA